MAPKKSLTCEFGRAALICAVLKPIMSFQIKGLTPGVQYRYRVVAMNKEGIRGPPSESVVANTLLETPAAPLVLVTKGEHPYGISHCVQCCYSCMRHAVIV